MTDFLVVARAASAIYFRQSEFLVFRAVPSPYGPLDLLFQTRRSPAGDVKEAVARGLWVEIRGEATTLKDAIHLFPQVAQAFCPILTVVANAPTEDLAPELAYDCSPGDTEREFFQQFLLDERLLPFKRPPFPVPAAYRVCELLASSAEQERLHRAMAHYHAALQNWAPGAEIVSLGYLWMGMEALTPVARRAELARLSLLPDALASTWGIEKKDLDAEVRRRLLFRGADETYSRAKKASDGFEHGFLPFQVVREHALRTKRETAGLLRSAILHYLNLEERYLRELLSPPFDTPPFLRVDKYIFGTLRGPLESLAAPEQQYPFLRWHSRLTGVQTNDDGTVDLAFAESFTPWLGPGVTFSGGSFEIWGGPTSEARPGDQQKPDATGPDTPSGKGG